MAAGLKSSCGWKMQRVLDLVAKSYFLTCESGNARLRHGLDSGPFVYRLGHQVFNLGRGVQLPYGLPSFPENAFQGHVNSCFGLQCIARIVKAMQRYGCAFTTGDPVRKNSLLSLTLICVSWLAAVAASAAPCGNTAAGYEDWKSVMAKEAGKTGIGARGQEALMGTNYSTKTIGADRNQKSFKYTLAKFLQVRGADAIVAQGRKRKAKNPDFYADLERSYGVPAGVILAIHGMETGFGGFMGDTNVVSAIATLAYDCRRTEFFTGHLLAALELVDRGTISSKTSGAKHGEIGHTQFLPGNVLAYGVDGNGDGRVDLTNQTDALASTANFLAQKGWRAGASYQKGEANFAVIKEWNAAGVYQQAIAIIGSKIDG